MTSQKKIAIHKEIERGEKSFKAAQVVPPVKEKPVSDLVKVLASFREIRKRISRRLKIRKLIEEGRRF